MSHCQEWLHIIKFLAKVASAGTPTQQRMLLRIFVALHKLAVRAYCWRHCLPNSLNRKKLSICLYRAFTTTGLVFMVPGRYFACYQKRKVKLNSATNSLDYKDGLPARCYSAIVAQNLWEGPSNIGLDFGPTSWGKTPAWCGSGGQELETK